MPMIHRPDTLPIQEASAISRAVDLINSGKLIAFPTDTVYGIGACAFSSAAVESIYQVKGRSHEKALPILVGDPRDLDQVTPPLSRIASLLAGQFWPGPLTLVVPLLPGLPENLSPLPTVGVRIPDHDLTRDLLRKTGPLAATSANRSGETPATTADGVIQRLAGKVDLVLDGGQSPGGLPSTVVDCSGEEPVLLREGPLAWSRILDLLSDSS